MQIRIPGQTTFMALVITSAHSPGSQHLTEVDQMFLNSGFLKKVSQIQRKQLIYTSMTPKPYLILLGFLLTEIKDYLVAVC